jgi:aromatic ring hydroxylase
METSGSYLSASDPEQTIAQIIQTVRKLKQGDRLRVLKFAEGIQHSRQGKATQRRKRHEQVMIEDWRIGS